VITFPYETGRFRAIEIDPPWRYKDRGYNGHDTVQKYRIHCPYPTMSLEEIEAMGAEINRVAAPVAHLWLWTTKDWLEDSFALLRAWGWTFKQIVTWVKTTKAGKPTYGMGHWMRNGCEYMLFAVNEPKNNFPLARTTTPNHLHAPRGGHSAKPEAAYDMIRANSPEPRLSIFQRSAREGFECWGNEMEETA
jgi:N6-adenosine-specific RNA methylase IME4